MSDLRVLAIDPGPVESAFVLWNGSAILTYGKLENTVMLYHVQKTSAPYLVIEQVACYGMAVGQEVFDTVFWSGRFWQAFRFSADRIPRLKAKMHLCHDSRAKDKNIRIALIDRLGPPGTKKNPGITYGVSKDVWSALAIAVTWWDQNIGVAA